MTIPTTKWTTGLAIALALAGPAMAAQQKDADAKKEEAPKPPVVVDLTLKETIGEEPPSIGLDGKPLEKNLSGLIDTIEAAAKDDEVKGLLLRFRDLAVGPGKANELRAAIKSFRESGKTVVAYLESGSNVDYWVATGADRIVMPDAGSLMLTGLAAEVTFFKGLFDKLGVQADYLQVGEYKGAAEPFTRTEMSPEFREELTAVLTDEFELLVEAIADGRGIDADAARSKINDGPYTAREAIEAGLVDELAYPDQIEAEIARAIGVEKVEVDDEYGEPEPEDYSGLAGLMKLMQELSGQGAKKAESDRPKVAVIYLSGVIQVGKSSSASLLGEAVMGSDTVVEQLEKAEKDETVKAIILRVDSPGGSALASDLIWRAVVESEKPIVASMSDTAASGGYYISMGCDRIIAEPGTLTGSIGVVGGKFALGGLLEKVGVSTDTVRVGDNGAIFSPFSSFNDEQEAAVREMMEETYRQFVGKAAKGRKMEFDALEGLAGGRIYSGRKAKQIGLVDELGTLDEAIAAARDLAGLKPDEDVELMTLPESKSIFEELSESLDDLGIRSPSVTVNLELPLPEPVRAMAVRAERFRRLLEREPAAVILPFEVQIR